MGRSGGAMNPKAVVNAYLQALQERDYERARTYLADSGFHYSSPIGTLDSADALVNQSFMSSSIVHSFRVRKVFVDGQDVCHFLVFNVQLSEKFAVDLVQWSTVEDGRIARIEVIFDAHPYRLMFPLAE